MWSELLLNFLCFVSAFILLANHISKCFCFKWETLLASWSKHFKLLTTQNPLVYVYLLYEWIFFYVVFSRVWLILCVFLNSFPARLSLFSLKPPRFSLFSNRCIVHWLSHCLVFGLLFFFFNLECVPYNSNRGFRKLHFWPWSQQHQTTLPE